MAASPPPWLLLAAAINDCRMQPRSASAPLHRSVVHALCNPRCCASVRKRCAPAARPGTTRISLALRKPPHSSSYSSSACKDMM